MNTLPVVTITRHASGWLAACTCGWERFNTYRAAADIGAGKHRAEHGKKALK